MSGSEPQTTESNHQNRRPRRQSVANFDYNEFKQNNEVYDFVKENDFNEIIKALIVHGFEIKNPVLRSQMIRLLKQLHGERIRRGPRNRYNNRNNNNRYNNRDNRDNRGRNNNYNNHNNNGYQGGRRKLSPRDEE